MANIYLGSELLNGSGVAGGGGGGVFPVRADITSTGIWSVPQAIQDKITNDSFCKVHIMLVGGGGSSQGGQVIEEYRDITSSYYYDQNNPGTIFTTIGAGGSIGGTTSFATQFSTAAYTRTLFSVGAGSTSGDKNYTNLSAYFVDDASQGISYTKSSNGNPVYNAIYVKRVNGQNVVTSTVFSRTYSNGIPNTETAYTTNYDNEEVRINVSSNSIALTNTDDPGDYWATSGLRLEVVSERASSTPETQTAISGTHAYGGNNTSVTASLNNKASAEGVFGGFGANVSSTANNSGHRGRSGLVRITYYG